jgi:BCD family chlorophyll transporter-like MFS transporter
MNPFGEKFAGKWMRIDPRFLPFADAVTPELPLSRLIRLSLFQVSVGMALVLLVGTLNRVMIVELGVHAWLVAVMVSLPLVFSPLRAIIGFRSDTHRSVLGWRRVPFIWIGTMLQFGGLAIMPFALLVLSDDAHGPKIVGEIGGALAFLLVGAGLHTTQTVGLALATDLAPRATQSRVVALLCVMLLVGMVISALIFGALLSDFSEKRLIQVVQGAAVVSMLLNTIALWKQEARDPSRTRFDQPRGSFRDSWKIFSQVGRSHRHLVAVAFGTVAFSMDDILLEPYGGQVLHLSVAGTTSLTALLAVGGVAGLALAARALGRKVDPYRLAAYGALAGIVAYSAVVFAAPLESPGLFALGTVLIGFGGGLFEVGTLTATVRRAGEGQAGLALGAWGAVQAFSAGTAIAAGGIISDLVSTLAGHGALGAALLGPATGYGVVYHLEIAFLFITLAAIGPLVRPIGETWSRSPELGAAEFSR